LHAGDAGQVAALAGAGEQGAEFGHAALDDGARVADRGSRERRGLGLGGRGRRGILTVRRSSSNRARREHGDGAPDKDDARRVYAHDPPENTTEKVTSEACSAPGVVGNRHPLILATVHVCTPGSWRVSSLIRTSVTVPITLMVMV